MKIKALAPWFGGKRTLAPRIIAQMGKHSQYFEPFGGGLSVLLNKPPVQKETVNDLHGDLTNLAMCVQELGTATMLYERLSSVVMCEGVLKQAQAELESSPYVDLGHTQPERAYWYFLASWMGRNGTAGTERQDYQIAVRWTKNGGSPTVRFRNAVESMPAWHRRLLNVVILNKNAFDITSRFEDVPETVIYADPPYAAETRSNVPVEESGKGGGGGGGRYLHEFRHAKGGLFDTTVDDHQRLAAMLRQYKKARIIVSAYDCPRYRELYEGWTFDPCPMAKFLHAQNGRGARRKEAPEVLIINGPKL